MTGIVSPTSTHHRVRFNYPLFLQRADWAVDLDLLIQFKATIYTFPAPETCLYGCQDIISLNISLIFYHGNESIHFKCCCYVPNQKGFPRDESYTASIIANNMFGAERRSFLCIITRIGSIGLSTASFMARRVCGVKETFFCLIIVAYSHCKVLRITY